MKDISRVTGSSNFEEMYAETANMYMGEEEEEYRSRLNSEWTSIVALQDMMGMGYKGARDKSSSYQQAMALGKILIPDLFNPETSILNKEKLSITAQKYLQLAEARGEYEKKKISPLDLLNQDIGTYRELLKLENPMQDVSLLKKELNAMVNALQELQLQKNTENALIFRDAY